MFKEDYTVQSFDFSSQEILKEAGHVSSLCLSGVTIFKSKASVAMVIKHFPRFQFGVGFFFSDFFSY